jgi:hypothetical protein
MRKTEKIIVAISTMALGILLVVLKADIISILMTVLGVALLVFGVIDVLDKRIPPAVIKAVSGALIILCSWVAVGVVLYVVAAVLLVLGILTLYEKIKVSAQCIVLWQTVCHYATSVLFIVIGILLLFNKNNQAEWVFVVGGICTVLQGGLVLLDAFTDD